jgi:hypothetical protein
MMKRYALDPNNLPQLSKTDLARIERMQDEDIDYSDIPELGDEFLTKEAVITNMKKSERRTRNRGKIGEERNRQDGKRG